MFDTVLCQDPVDMSDSGLSIRILIHKISRKAMKSTERIEADEP